MIFYLALNPVVTKHLELFVGMLTDIHLKIINNYK